MAARPDPAWDAITVSYAPSAAMFAYLAGRPVPAIGPPPSWPSPTPPIPSRRTTPPHPSPPPPGCAVARVVPNGNADLNGLREGDVLLSYAGTELKQPGDLKPVASDGGPRKVPVKYWREGITREVELAAGPLGVAIDPRPAAAFVRARRESERVLLGMRGGSHARLPGTRREVEALAALFPDGGATTILGPQACEATVQGLARSGKLKGYRYLHFATHGESDPRFAYRTALILAPDPDSGADPTATETDGTITAEQIARTWELDADLVVLSACESGLGRAAGGEGYLGFAQPLFARGARSLVLSQWKVDDDATALLDGPVLPQPAGEARGPEGADAQGRGAGRGQAMAPRRRAGGGRRGAGGAAARRDRPPRGGEGRILGASVRGPDLLGGVRPGRGAGLRGADPPGRHSPATAHGPSQGRRWRSPARLDDRDPGGPTAADRLSHPDEVNHAMASRPIPVARPDGPGPGRHAVDDPHIGPRPGGQAPGRE